MGIVVAGYFVSQPGKGTAEWHKRGYLQSYQRMMQNTLKQKLQRLYRWATRRPPASAHSSAWVNDARAFEHHLTSLIQLGYVHKARISLTNETAENVMKTFYRGRNPDDTVLRFINISPDGAHNVQIIGPPSALPTIAAAIRQADRAETPPLDLLMIETAIRQANMPEAK